MNKRPCHLCNSTHWPSPTTTCPLCFGDPDPEPDYDEDDYDHFVEATEMVADAMLTEEIKHE